MDSEQKDRVINIAMAIWDLVGRDSLLKTESDYPGLRMSDVELYAAGAGSVLLILASLDEELFNQIEAVLYEELLSRRVPQ